MAKGWANIQGYEEQEGVSGFSFPAVQRGPGAGRSR